MNNLAIKKLLAKGVKSLIGRNLYDRVINVELYKVGAEVKFAIECKAGGYKPDIEVSVSILPNNVCYHMTVRITNCSMRGQINIRSLDVMRVTCGYQDGPQTVFTGPIFSSYQESPNPDGVTVFEGVVVGEQGNSLLNKNAYRLIFYKNEVTVKELCEKVALKLGLILDMTAVSPALQNAAIKVEMASANAANGLAVLQWLNDTLFRWSTAVAPFESPKDNNYVLTTNNPNTLYVLWTEDTLRVIQAALLPAEVDSIKDVVILDAVKTASYNATVLHVQSLFVPSLKPGGTFYMDPHFFKGGTSMGNMLTAATYNPDDGLYKVIKMDVKFSTTGSTNEMDIMAVPFSQGGGL